MVVFVGCYKVGALMKYVLLAIFLISSAAGITAAVAHGGGTDANGCHNDRKNGGYHCH
jgi:hypothetical protein